MNKPLMQPTLEPVRVRPNRNPLYAWIITGLTLALVGYLWATRSISDASFMYEVPRFMEPQGFLETSWLYMYLHIFTMIPVLALSFDRRVHFYRKWKYLFPGIAVVATAFIVWDVFFTEWRVWGFNESYFLGVRIFGLPIEEWLFFFTVPYACLFVYECLNYYVKPDLFGSIEKVLTPALVIGCFVFGLISWEATYTSTTFLLTGGALAIHYLYVHKPYRSRFYFAYLIVWIPFTLVDGALTGGFTAEPVVLYHPEEFWGIRVGSIPMEDAVYNFLMLLGITTIFEKLRGKQWSR